MSDDKSKRGPADKSRINVNEPYELAYWTMELGISSQVLREAVKTVGVMVADVKRHLEKR